MPCDRCPPPLPPATITMLPMATRSQVWEALVFLRTKLGSKQFAQLLYVAAVGAAGVGAAGTAILVLSGKLNPWTGR